MSSGYWRIEDLERLVDDNTILYLHFSFSLCAIVMRQDLKRRGSSSSPHSAYVHENQLEVLGIGTLGIPRAKIN